MKEPIPYIAHEAAMTRMERHTKRLWIALITTIALMFATNALWIYEWCQYDYGIVAVNSEDGGNANYIGNDGDIYNGESYGSQEN